LGPGTSKRHRRQPLAKDSRSRVTVVAPASIVFSSSFRVSHNRHVHKHNETCKQRVLKLQNDTQSQ
jgi:hypothetical protein